MAGAIVLWVITGGFTDGPQTGSSAQASSGPATTFPLRAATAFGVGAVPAYYVAVGGRSAEVGATATGAVLATIRTPAQSAGTFEYVSGAAGDRLFVLAAVRRLRTELYLLRLNPHARAATLSPLPFSVTTGPDLQFAGLALSPDGRKLAVALNSWAPARGGDSRIWVYDLATGSRREWLWSGPGLMSSLTAKGQASLSWAAGNKTVAFEMQPGSTGWLTQVRLLDTGAPGSDLGKARVVVQSSERPDAPLVSIQSPMITPDGTKIVLGRYQAAALRHGSLPETLSIGEYSSATGQLLASSYEKHYVVPPSDSGNPGPAPSILWANPAGTVLIILTGAAVAQESPAIDMLRDGTLTPLPDNVLSAAGTVAW